MSVVPVAGRPEIQPVDRRRLVDQLEIDTGDRGITEMVALILPQERRRKDRVLPVLVVQDRIQE